MRKEILLLITAERELRERLLAAIMERQPRADVTQDAFRNKDEGERMAAACNAREQIARWVAGWTQTPTLSGLLTELETYANGDSMYRCAEVQAELREILARGRDTA